MYAGGMLLMPVLYAVGFVTVFVAVYRFYYKQATTAFERDTCWFPAFLVALLWPLSLPFAFLVLVATPRRS